MNTQNCFADLPFSADKTICIETGFQTVARLNASFASTMRKEAEMASMHPFAWNPEFGYVTANPRMCGTCLEISATFHLEGLHLIGDLEPALNALNALRFSARVFFDRVCDVFGRSGFHLSDARGD